MNQFLNDHSREIEKILAKYPPEHKRSALLPFLAIAQADKGFVEENSIKDIAAILDLETTEVASLIGFYTLFYDKPTTPFRIQVCTDLSCELIGAKDFLKDLCTNLKIKPGEATADGLVTVEEVKCLAGCDRAPVFQLQDKGEITYHEHMTVEKTLDLISELKKHTGELK